MTLHEFLVSLIILYVSARVFGELAVRLGQSAVLGDLVAGLMQDSGKFPLGADVWRGTVLPVSSSKRGTRYRNVLTGAVLAPVEAGGTRVLALADIFRDCPVALLERVAG